MVPKFGFVLLALFAIVSLTPSGVNSEALVETEIIAAEASLNVNELLELKLYIDLAENALVDPSCPDDVKAAIKLLLSNEVTIRPHVEHCFSEISAQLTVPFDITVQYLTNLEAHITADAKIDAVLKTQLVAAINVCLTFLQGDLKAQLAVQVNDAFAKLKADVDAKVSLLKINLVSNLQLIIKACDGDLLFKLTTLSVQIKAGCNKIILDINGGIIDADLKVLVLKIGDTTPSFSSVLQELIETSATLRAETTVASLTTLLSSALLMLEAKLSIILDAKVVLA